MANREENLKKINDELEKLDDEELEKVAGGKHWTIYYQTPNSANDQNTPAHQLALKKAIKWD